MAGDDEPSPRNYLRTFKRLIKAGDIVRHMEIGSFWVNCGEFVELARQIYGSETRRQSFKEDYRYVSLLFDYVKRLPARHEYILGELGETLKVYVR